MSSNNTAYIYLVETPKAETDLPAAKLFTISGWIASKEEIANVSITVDNQTVTAELTSRRDVQKAHKDKYKKACGFSALLDSYVISGKSEITIKISFLDKLGHSIGTESHTIALSAKKSDTPHYVKSRSLSFIKPLAPLDILLKQNSFTIQGWTASEVKIGRIELLVNRKLLDTMAQSHDVKEDAHRAHFHLPDRFTHMARFSEKVDSQHFSDVDTVEIELLVYSADNEIVGRDKQLIRKTDVPKQPELTLFPRSSTHDYLLVFHHLEKTAGTTIRHVISRQYEPEELYYVYNGELKFRGLEDFKLLSNSQLDSLNIILGHNVRNLDSRITRPIRNVTFLRNPVDRLLSLYSFVSRHPNTLLNRVVKDNKLNFIDFVVNIHDLSGIKYTGADNSLVRKISGVDARCGECDEHMLHIAKNRILNDFSMVGLVERFDESLLLMRRAFGWRTPFYTKSNVSKNRKKRQELTPSEYQKIEPFVKYDMEFYQYAEELLNQKIKLAGQSFQRELEEFTVVNNFSHKWLQ